MITLQNIIDTVERLEQDERFANKHRSDRPLGYDRSKNYNKASLVDAEIWYDYDKDWFSVRFSSSLHQPYYPGDYFSCDVPGFWYGVFMNTLAEIIREEERQENA